MIKKLCLCALALMSIVHLAFADDYAELVAYRDSLKQQIEELDSEIARCEKTMKDWKTATIIGGIGAVASGIGIIAQTQQVKENKKVLQDISEEAKEAEEATQFMEKVKQ